MNISGWLNKNVKLLEGASISTARLDCLVLLEDTTCKKRTHLLAYPNAELSDEQLTVLKKQIGRRLKHEPLAYIRGKSEFYGREFLVNEHTLEPRPETEAMIESFKKLGIQKGTAIDVGTGSGCIAITVKLEIPKLNVIATDIDQKCIQTARRNAKNHGAKITFREGNLLEAIPETADAVLCNLPYVPDKYEINAAAKHEPKHAIFGGPDGLDLYRKLFVQTKSLDQKPMFILTESLPFQHEELAKIATSAGYQLQDTDDFIQVFELLS